MCTYNNCVSNRLQPRRQHEKRASNILEESAHGKNTRERPSISRVFLLASGLLVRSLKKICEFPLQYTSVHASSMTCELDACELDTRECEVAFELYRTYTMIIHDYMMRQMLPGFANFIIANVTSW